MPKLLIFFILNYSFFSYSQDSLLIDRPIKKLKSSGFNVYLEVDSVKEVSTRAEILYVDAVDYLIPAKYTVYQEHSFSAKYHFLATWQCGDSSYHGMSYIIPNDCQYWTAPDSNTLYTTSVVKNNYRTIAYRPDSVLKTDMNCVSEFYQIESDSVRSDTLYEKEGTAFYELNFNEIPYWECSYYYDQKHGKELAYYHVNEVSGKCVNADTNLKKYEGQWKYGKKKGKWYFYDIYGELEKIEFYRKGICKKIKDKKNT
jgi:hypothetical protein